MDDSYSNPGGLASPEPALRTAPLRQGLSSVLFLCQTPHHEPDSLAQLLRQAHSLLAHWQVSGVLLRARSGDTMGYLEGQNAALAHAWLRVQRCEELFGKARAVLWGRPPVHRFVDWTLITPDMGLLADDLPRLWQVAVGSDGHAIDPEPSLLALKAFWLRHDDPLRRGALS